LSRKLNMSSDLLKRAQSNLSLGTSISDTSSLQDSRRQLRSPSIQRSGSRPPTAYDTSAGASPNTDNVSYRSSQGLLSPTSPSGGGYSVVRNTHYASDNNDGYFVALDPSKPPDQWTFTPAITSGTSTFKSSYSTAGNTVLSSDMTNSQLSTNGTVYTSSAQSDQSPSLIGTTPTSPRIEPFVSRRSVAADSREPTFREDFLLSGSTGIHSVNMPTLPEHTSHLTVGSDDTHTARSSFSKRTGNEQVSTNSSRIKSASMTSSSNQPPLLGISAPHMTYHRSHRGLAEETEIAKLETSITVPSVRVDREYRQDERCRFVAEPMPTALEGRITPEEFRETIQALNNLLASGEDSTGRSFLRNLFSCATLYLGFCCTRSNYQLTLDKASAFLAEENKRLYRKRGLQWRDPRETAFLHVSIVWIRNVGRKLILYVSLNY
jgi:hypothetical protein